MFLALDHYKLQHQNFHLYHLDLFSKSSRHQNADERKKNGFSFEPVKFNMNEESCGKSGLVPSNSTIFASILGAFITTTMNNWFIWLINNRKFETNLTITYIKFVPQTTPSLSRLFYVTYPLKPHKTRLGHCESGPLETFRDKTVNWGCWIPNSEAKDYLPSLPPINHHCISHTSSCLLQVSKLFYCRICIWCIDL